LPSQQAEKLVESRQCVSLRGFLYKPLKARLSKMYLNLITRHIYFFILCVFLTGLAFSQDSLYKISGRVTDDVTKQPLKNVSIQISGTLQGTTTDSSGLFKLEVRAKDIVLVFSIIGYDNKVIKANYRSYSGLFVGLAQRLQVLNEVVINASPVEQVIVSKKSNVLDYDFYNDHILIITYGNDLSGSKLILINQSFDTLSKINIPEEPTGLFKDCLGNNHVVCEKSIYQVYTDSFGMHLLPPQPIQSFERVLYPCIAADSSNVYLVKKSGAVPVETGFHVFDSHNHTVSYTYVNKLTKQQNSLAKITDEELVQKRKEELLYEKNKQAAGLYNHGSQGQDRLFFETILVKEIYAPLYTIKGRTYIFDYINSFILSYDSRGKLLNRTAIAFHRDKSWKRDMCVDEKSGKAFAIFENKGITEIKEINVNDGQINRSYKIPFIFIKNIKARDGYVYFLYKGPDYIGARCLSRLKVN
jgi:hypothetical protein